MTTALVVAGATPGSADLAADLESVGIHVLGACARDVLVREAARTLPDVVVWHELSADDTLFDACALLAEAAPRPVAVFTSDPDAAHVDRAMRSGIHAWVVAGYEPRRLRAVLQVALSRFAREAELQRELADVTRRYGERKLVDRAKGILMRARELSEDEAFAVLRAASMHSNRRVGQVSRQVISAARDADAVNRAGKLRMLSQRLVKLAAIGVAEPGVAAHRARLADASTAIDAHLQALGRSLSRATFGDLLDAVGATWTPLQSLAAADAPHADRLAGLAGLDALAEALLREADRLVAQLEAAGLVKTLSIINVSGRQRMLAQRHAKQALLALVLQRDPAGQARAGLAETATRLTEVTAQLQAAPLTTPEIRSILDAAVAAWATLERSARVLPRSRDVRALDAASDALSDLFERLTACYERSMQVLMG